MFENRYVSDKKMQAEYVNKVICRKLILQGRLISVLFFVLAYYFYSANARKETAIVSLWGILILVICIFLPVYIRYKIDKKSKARFGEDVQTVIVCDSKIRITKGDEKKAIDYDDVKELYFLKNIIALSVSKYDGVFLSRRGFTKGEEEAFCAWIEEKCKNAKVVERKNFKS